MDSHYLQQQRYLLQKKVKRLNSCSYKLFHSLHVQFWGYLRDHAIYGGVLAKLSIEAPAYTAEIETAKNGEVPVWGTELQAVHFNYRMMEYCASQPIDRTYGPEVNIGYAIFRRKEFAESLDGFRDAFLEPFYEHLDEAIDGQAAVLSLLLKYKRHVEWFVRDDVKALIEKGGERSVARHMYAYLFDQGLDFHIEPQSVSGEADLVAKELVLDAKLFDGTSGHGKSYVLRGVNQLLTYTRDFQQQVGYLAMYRTCPEDLQFAFARSDMLVPFLVIGGRIIYFLVIDVCDHGASASKRGTLKSHVIDESEVLTIVKEQALPDPKNASS